MSAQQERRLDHLYKAFMVITLSVCSFFLIRLVNSVDKASERIEQLEIDVAVIKNEIRK